MEQAELYEEDWDSEEFQTALKVVIKCEIQSLLERLSATGEETVLLTASASQLSTGHLASPKARNFVNTLDIGNMKNKFLNFITGSVVAGSHTSQKEPVGQGTIPAEPEIPAFLYNNYNPAAKKTETVNKPAEIKSVSVNNQVKTVEKRPLESGQLSQTQTTESKRRKTEVTVPPLASKGVLDNLAANVSSNVTFSQPSSSANVNKLKTTKVVSKSGGFTEERLSDAEFQKILAKYKGPKSSQEETENKIPSGSQPLLSQQKQLQASAGTSKLNKTVSLSAACAVSPTFSQTGTISQNIVNQSTSACGKGNTNRKPEINILKSDVKNSSQSELVLDMKSELEAENLPSQAAKTVIEKGTNKGPSDKDRLVSEGVTKKIEEKDQSASTSENRLDNIDNLDTETLIRMTKQKHYENMSEADREIQAKLGQLSSKLSWVVEYPKDAKGQKSLSGQRVLTSKCSVQEGMAMPPPGLMHDPYIDNDDEEMDLDYEEDDDEDDEFNEDDLDDEDKATLNALRAARLQKLRNSGNMEGYEEGELFAQGFGLQEGYEMGEGQMLGQDYGEHYDEEGEYSEEYDELEGETDPQIHRMMLAANERLQGPNMMTGLGKVLETGEIPQPYAQASSPLAENFQMIGPIMAKCLICNKIIRKVEIKSHHENHLKELPYDDEEEEDEEDIEEMQEMRVEQDGNEYGEGLEEMAGEEYAEEEEYDENCGELGEDPDIEPEFTAEKFVAEKLVAEKVDASVENEDNKSFVCDICNKSLKTKASLLRHKKNVHSVEKETSEIQCPCCSKTFKTPTNFQKHLKKVHPDYEKTLQGEANDGPEAALGYIDNYTDNVHNKAVASSE